ncbi:MAG: spore germination protein [Clostridiaceae bacterium]
MDSLKKIDEIKNLIGDDSRLIIRNLLMGKGSSIKATLVYIKGLAEKNVIDRGILSPLMLNVNEELSEIEDLDQYIYNRYITVSNSYIETDINKVIENIKRGKTALLLEKSSNYIVIDTSGGEKRSIQEPANEVAITGPREGFLESLNTNISILKRRIKDGNLKIENLKLGRRSQTDVSIMYIDDIVDKEYLKKLKSKIKKIDFDYISDSSTIEQCIEEHPYSIFPQAIGSEKPDVVEAKLMEGRIAVLVDGTPNVTTYPTIFVEFFQTKEDYYERTIVTFLTRIIRCLAVFIVITVPSIYITLIKFNAEMIPIEFIKSLVELRKGIALTPFVSLLSITITIEILREGGLRLPNKIAQTLSVVGGIIIGDAVIAAKIISAPTLLVAGIATVASFAISNYQMSIAIRSLSYPMLFLANWLGMLGIVIGWYFILAYLSSLENLEVPYFSFTLNDLKDVFIRVPIWKMNKRPDAIPHNDSIRQKDFRRRDNE